MFSGQTRSRAPFVGVLVATVAIAAGAAALVRSAGPDQAWASFGGGPDNSRYVAAAQITKANVARLAVAWNYPFADTSFSPVWPTACCTAAAATRRSWPSTPRPARRSGFTRTCRA